MKKKFLWMLTAIVACCISFTLASCSVEDNVPPSPTPEPPAPFDPKIEPIDPVRCTAAVDMGDISGLPAELQTALKKRMVNLTSNGEADICFCTVEEAEKYAKEQKKGTTIVVAMPAAGSEFNNLVNIAGGVIPNKTQLPVMFYASQKYGRHYLMLDDGVPEYVKTTEEKVTFYEKRIIPLIY